MTSAKPKTEANAPEPAPSQERAEVQEASKKWPEPGEEGFVHPDGTPQAERQLADNKQAAADREAKGSLIDGAPAH